MIKEARILAHRAHQGQLRKGSSNPYIEHPERVFDKIMTLLNPTEEMLCAALLHDVLEDCPQITEDEILAATNKTTLRIVQEMTNPSKEIVMPRAERKQMDRNHLAKCSTYTKLIKLADRIDNLNDMKGMDRGFCRLYALESALLLVALKGTYQPWENELETILVKNFTKYF